MNTMLKLLLGVTLLSGLAARNVATNATGPAQDDNASQHAFKKKAKDVNRPEPTPDVAPAPQKGATDAAGPRHDEGSSQHAFKKKAKDVNRPEPTPDVAPAPKPR